MIKKSFLIIVLITSQFFVMNAHTQSNDKVIESEKINKQKSIQEESKNAENNPYFSYYVTNLVDKAFDEKLPIKFGLLLVTFLTGAAITLVVSYYGFYKKIDKYVGEKIKVSFYNHDATNLRIHLPVDFDEEKSILKKWGFKNFNTYKNLTEIYDGILIYTSSDLGVLATFVGENISKGKNDVGIILYTSERIDSEILKKLTLYPYFLTANYPATLANAIWNVSRGLS